MPKKWGKAKGSFAHIQLPCGAFHHLALEDLGSARRSSQHKHQPANSQTPSASIW